VLFDVGAESKHLAFREQSPSALRHEQANGVRADVDNTHGHVEMVTLQADGSLDALEQSRYLACNDRGRVGVALATRAADSAATPNRRIRPPKAIAHNANQVQPSARPAITSVSQ